jgi:DNA-binding MarR family transcriptional regulator
METKRTMPHQDRRAELHRELAREWRLLGSELVLLTQAVSDRLGVNGTDLQCLGILTSAGAMTAGELAERTGLTTGAVTGVVDRLEQAGLVSRDRDPADRRRVIVRPLSDEDLRRRAPELDAVYGAVAQGGAHADAAYTDDQLELVIDFLRRTHPVIHNQIAAVRQGGGTAGDQSAPLAGVTAGHLVFTAGVSQLALDAEAGADELYRAHFEGTVPEVRVEGGTVTVRYRRFSLFEGRSRGSRFGLNPSIPWEVEIRGGAASCTADLRELRLRGLEVKGGASAVEIDLGAPTGTVPLRLIGGASRFTVRRPAGTALTLAVRGGVSRLSMDGQEFGAIGGQVRLQSREYREGGDHYVLELTGGASRLSVETR